MESAMVWDHNSLVKLLNFGEEQIRQLQAYLNEPSQAESCKNLAQEIQSILSKAISLAKFGDPEHRQPPMCPTGANDFPASASDSPRSDGSERASKDLERREMCKKRKTLPTWTSQVLVAAGTALDPSLDDGYSWRKYGQKDILGAKYPRGYYRCTYRNTQGCLAMKQVQKSDENPCVFHVTYRGEHTCYKSKLAPASVSKKPKIQQNEHNSPDQSQQQFHQNNPLLMSFRTSLKVKTEGLDSENQGLISSPFFPCTPVSSLTPENHIFSSPPSLENHYMGSFSPTFISPTTSESNYFSVSPCPMRNYGGGPNLYAAESDATEIISAMTSTTNSPVVDIGLPEFDPDFLLDSSHLFM